LEIQFYGDASGRARKTSAIASDWDIIMQEFPGAQIFVPKSNPPVERRVASVNAAFRNGKLKIDARCKTLIKDLETLAYKPGSPIFDLRDPNIGHSRLLGLHQNAAPGRFPATRAAAFYR
jgi:hypothetical protein